MKLKNKAIDYISTLEKESLLKLICKVMKNTNKYIIAKIIVEHTSYNLGLLIDEAKRLSSQEKIKGKI